MQSETLAQEFARLVKEYHEGDDRTKPEAWNLLADYAVDNAEAISAALSDKQAVEVAIKPLEWNRDDDTASVDIGATYCLEKRAGYCALVTMAAKVLQRDVFPTVDAAKAAAQSDYERLVRSALVDVPAVESVGDDLIGYVLRYGGICRDCADMDGVCQSGQPCDTDQRRAVIKHTIAALAYGIKHGFIANPFTSPPLSREGENSAELERKFKLGDRVTKTKGSSWQGHVVGFYSTALTPVGYAVESEREPGSVQIYPESALAATRSGSATSPSGTSPTTGNALSEGDGE